MKVFVSYSHDSSEHQARVLRLANSLRQFGIDCDLDQFHEAGPPEGWPAWTRRMIQRADKVLVVCTETYRRRWDQEEAPGQGEGATWEAGKILRDLYKGQGKNTKYVPVLFSKQDKAHIPDDLVGFPYYVVESDDQFERLYRALTGRFSVQPVPVGPSPDLGTKEGLPLFRLPGGGGTGKPTRVAERPQPMDQAEGRTREKLPRKIFLEEQASLALSYLPASRAEDFPSQASLERYAELFRLVLDTEETPPQGSLFEFLAGLALEQPGDLLRIQGESGTGKTALLAVFYFYLRESKRGVLPFFLHLGKYDEMSPEDALRECQSDLAQIEWTMSDSDESRVILLIDGFDKFLEFRREVEEQVIGWHHSAVKKVVGVGLGIDPSDHPERYDWDYAPAVTLKSLRKEDSYHNFLHAFLATTAYPDKALVEKSFASRIENFRFTQINFRTLALLTRLRERRSYAKVRSLSDLFGCYTRELLAPNATDREYEALLKEAAELAYAHVYKAKDLSPSEQRQSRGWLLAHRDVDLNDYLIASHVAHSLLNAGAGNGDLSVLSRIYSYRITRHAKEILTKTSRRQSQVIEAAKRIAQSDDPIIRTNVSYFLGRLTDDGEKQKAVNLLREMRDREDEQSNDMKILRLLRTIYVSLIYLGNREASREYIERLIERPVWDHINRGFHLEYYGDISVDPWQDFTHQDTKADFPKTFDRLHDSIKKNLPVRSYVPHELEIYTIFSLAQKRHAQGELKDQLRSQLLLLLDNGLAERLDSEALRKYLRMLHENLRQEAFSIGDVVEDLYEIKEEKRKGWVNRGLQGTESVADHMYGAFLLGLLFLPDGSKDYDKDTILKMMLVHDLAEAYTGDIVSMEKREDDREREAGWFDYIGMLGTYTEIADLREVARLWRAYEARDTLNAKIGHDLDRIDTYVQMHLYQRKGEIKDLESWKAEVKRKVLTKEGREILDLLERHFERKAQAKL